MNAPNPAIVSQAAAHRLPRLGLLFLCIAYVLAGFIGRDAWKNADVAALGFMAELVQTSSQSAGAAHWLTPTLLGMPSQGPGPLPYWLGAWMLRYMPDGLVGAAGDFAVRIPFMLLLTMAMLGTWYGTYYLARNRQAQPVAFAFGGEAAPKDYARAIADGGLLALIACLGLAQLAHGTTPALAQLGFAALAFFAFAVLRYRPFVGSVSALIGLVGLSLCGAPTMALLFGLGGFFLTLQELVWHKLGDAQTADLGYGLQDALDVSSRPQRQAAGIGAVALAVLLSAGCAQALDLWRWRVEWPQADLAHWSGIAQLLVWFPWPAWPLALWTLWRWRKQIFNRHFSLHLVLPLWFVVVSLCATVVSGASDRTLLLGLPALAALAAFALPTLQRQVAALIDWFTLLFFSGCGLTIWVVWIAMQTGYPSQPAANVARLAPGFTPAFSALEFVCAVAATLVWAWLVKWRVGRHRVVMWRSLVLPAGGAALCWLLLMTLWMPLLDYAQSYTVMVQRAVVEMRPAGCVEVLNVGEGKIAALKWYGNLPLQVAGVQPQCPWLITEPGSDMATPSALDMREWNLMSIINHPTDGNETLLLFRRR